MIGSAPGVTIVSRNLTYLVEAVGDARLHGPASDVRITDLAYDSRRVEAGSLFFCVPGARTDGHDHALDAVAAGAAALVVERVLDVPVPQVVVPSTRRAMGPIAAAFHEHPSRAMTLIGVTGTNGKTTSTFMLDSVIRSLGWTAGLVGPVETRIGDVVEPVTRTTPESIDLQDLFARMRDVGVRAAAMEVSSHGLAWHRVDGTSFACGVFTNLTQDHLDDHGTMEAYFEAKAMLFERAFTDRAVVNADDAYGRALLARIDLPEVLTFGIDEPADVSARIDAMDARSSRILADVRGERVPVTVPLPARYNVSNALGVLGVASLLGWPLDAVADGIARMTGVPGRLERIEAGQDFTVVVDYAHTADALDNVLRAAREITPEDARLVCVFGCGGDRDRGKRPLMGRAAVAVADHVIITSDNPRSEDPRAIIAEIEGGARDGGAPYDVEPDRRAAIARAIDAARPGDVIVIAGKGHETGQQFADQVIPFDDRTVVREALEARRRG